MIGQGYLDNLHTRLDALLHELAEGIAVRARVYAPMGTGKLRDSIKAVDNTVVVAVPYAAAVEADQPFLRAAIEELL